MSPPETDMRHNLPQADLPYKVMALYKFADLPDAAALRLALEEFCAAHAIMGTLLLAPEGINGTIAGTPAAIQALAARLLADPRFTGAEIKYSSAAAMPFLRLKVRLKAEIVTLRAPEANPAKAVGRYVAPQDWNRLIERNDVVLIDTRNDYEVGLGSFSNAIDPGTPNFTAFKDFVAQKLDPARDKKVAMFCTGGIRCEKASAYLLSRGFEQVFHLKGGILGYLEQVPTEQSRFNGECFVFDERVSVGHGLVPGDASLCRACRHPLTAEDRADPAYREGICCRYCAGEEAKHAAAAERQHQIALAKARGRAHLGDAARTGAHDNRASKQARMQADRERAAALPASRRQR